MKFAVICCHSPEYREFAVRTVYTNKAQYCGRHGYDLRVRTEIDPQWQGSIHVNGISWDRLAYLQRLLRTGTYDWIYCVGTDTLITNMQIPLDSFTDDTSHLVISPDWCAPVQADSFLVRCNQRGDDWVSDVLSQFPRLKLHPWVENQAMIDLLPKWKDTIKILPQRRLNAYDYALYKTQYGPDSNAAKGLDYFGNDGQWQRGDYLVHWPGQPLNERWKLYQRFQPLIVY